MLLSVETFTLRADRAWIFSKLDRLRPACRSIRASDFSDLGSGHTRRSVSSQTSVKNYVKALAEDFCYSGVERRKCKSCGDEAASVEFKPCGHKIVCAGTATA